MVFFKNLLSRIHLPFMLGYSLVNSYFFNLSVDLNLLHLRQGHAEQENDLKVVVLPQKYGSPDSMGN